MSVLSRVARRVVTVLSPEDLEDLIDDILGDVLARMEAPERLAFVRRVVERSLNQLMMALSREERAELMNALLPRLAQTFPLADLDILDAFASWEDEGSQDEGV